MQNSNYSKCNREAKDIMLYSLAGHCQVQCSVIQCSAEASEVQCAAMQNSNYSECNREAKDVMLCSLAAQVQCSAVSYSAMWH